MSNLVKPKEAAEMLQMTVQTLREHIRDGTLPRVIIGRGKIKKHYAIDTAAIEIFKRDRTEIGSRPACPSTSRKARAPSTTMTSNSGVIDFLALRNERRKKRLEKLKI